MDVQVLASAGLRSIVSGTDSISSGLLESQDRTKPAVFSSAGEAHTGAMCVEGVHGGGPER